MVTMKGITVLIAFIIGGFFMTFVPDPLDIVESILVSIGNNCQTEQCIDNSNTLLNSYHIGGLILSIGSILVLIKSIVRP
jgi:hypothetical protein